MARDPYCWLLDPRANRTAFIVGRFGFRNCAATTKQLLLSPISWLAGSGPCGVEVNRTNHGRRRQRNHREATLLSAAARLWFDLMTNRSDRRGAMPRTTLAFAGRRHDWLPARGFHHGPELAPLKRPKIRVQSDLITPPTSSLAAEIGIG